jgi:hypothetical protein
MMSAAFPNLHLNENEKGGDVDSGRRTMKMDWLVPMIHGHVDQASVWSFVSLSPSTFLHLP